MTGFLLADVMPIAIGAGCAFAALSLLYGIFKKSSRMSWSAWEVLILFALSFALDSVSGSPLLVFLFTAGGFFLVTAGLHALESFCKRKLGESLSSGVRLADRLLGALIAVVSCLAVVLALGGLALCIVYTFVTPEFALFQSSVWTNFLGKHILDLSLIAVLVGAYKSGYRLGLLKAIWGLLGIAATGGLFVGAFCAATQVGFLKDLSSKIAGSLKLGAGVATLLGNLIVTLICFVVFFAVLAVIFALVNWLVKKLNRHAVFNVVDGTLLAVIFFVLVVAVLAAAHFGIYYLAQNAEGMLGEMGGTVAQYLQSFGEMLSSSPLSRIFFEYNPIRLLVG